MRAVGIARLIYKDDGRLAKDTTCPSRRHTPRHIAARRVVTPHPSSVSAAEGTDNASRMQGHVPGIWHRQDRNRDGRLARDIAAPHADIPITSPWQVFTPHRLHHRVYPTVLATLPQGTPRITGSIYKSDGRLARSISASHADIRTSTSFPGGRFTATLP